MIPFHHGSLSVPSVLKYMSLITILPEGVNEGKDILVLIRVNRAKTKRWIRVFERQQQFPMVQTLCGGWIRETESPPPALYPLSPP
jgi:hypothetical protein